MNVRLTAAALLLCVTATAQAAPFAKGDDGAGKKIFDQHKCNSCHARQLGGDGNSMFTRAERKVKTHTSLAAQITRCSNNLGLMLFDEDEEHVGAYLNKHYYKFK